MKEAKPHAEKTGAAVLDEKEVRHIRAIAGKVSVAELAWMYGVGRETIRRILRRETWDWVKDEEAAPSLSPAEQNAADASLEALLKLNPEIANATDKR